MEFLIALLMAFLGYVCIDKKRYTAFRKMTSQLNGYQIKLTDTSYKAARLFGFVLFIVAGGILISSGFFAFLSLI